MRWIDLGCPIDLDYDPKKPAKTGLRLDARRPAADADAHARRRPARTRRSTRILVGMHDYGTGLDAASFAVIADFAVDGVARGSEPGGEVQGARRRACGELKLTAPLAVKRGKLTVSVKDRQGNVTRIERTFSAGKE